MDGRRRLRVALVTSSYNYIADGVALTLNRLVAYLQSQGVEVLVVTPVARAAAFAHEGEIAAAPSAPMPFRSEYRFAFGLTPALRRRLEAFDPDIVHIATPDVLGRQALAFAQARGTPVVASYHTRYETYLKDYGLKFLEDFVAAWLRRFYDSCDEVYAPSASMAEHMASAGFADNIRLWARGVDTRRFHPGRRSLDFRARLGIGEGEPVIAFVGRLVREKRLDTLIEVVAALRRAGVAHRVLIVGDGPDRPMLERGLQGALFTGFLTGDELAIAYASADIFLFPSDTESFGNVTLEAMASGLPTVAADATGSRSLVTEGVTGFLAPAGAPADFVEPLSSLAVDVSMRRTMGQAARARSLEFSWDAAMGGLLARYETLAQPRRAVA
ncbi:MAG TPA: glycosyltransferase family 1 protein [Caulobacteraceae bacterium]